VRPAGGQPDSYEIVAGERRWRAAQKAQLHEVPVVVRTMGDLDALQLGLIENLQRADLSAIDEARGYRRLMTDFTQTQEDVAKVVGVAATHAGDILEYVWDHPNVRPIEHELPYFVALPTTSGTGSEVGRSSVVSENDTHLKRVVFSPKILARCVFADPELTLGLPAHVTAATGMDALTHNVESYLSPAYHPLCDGIALEGTRIAAAALLTAVTEPGNLQARSDMMMASMMGAIAFQKDLGAVHSCAHALGAVCDLHHGLANALMIDTVMAWNYVAAPEKFDELAHVCKVASGGKGFVSWLKQLKVSVGITGGLASHGVKPEHLPRLVEIANADMCHQTNPRPCKSGDFETLFKAAM
jgi:alcohol dehydrogenase class IV